MKTPRIILSLVTVSSLLISANIANAQLQLKCNPDKTVECDSIWHFDEPTVLGACCTKVTLSSNTVSNLGPCVSTWTRTWQVTDCCTNAICSQTVTVADFTPPQLFCSNLTSNCTQSGGTHVNFNVLATDNCDPSPTVTYHPPSGSFFPVGMTLVTATATDACGLTNSCVFTVKVLDNCPIDCVKIYCPGTNVFAYACNTNGALVSFFIVATNYCDPNDLMVVCDPAPNTWFHLGNTIVNCWAIGSGESNHCSFTVSVISNCPPSCLSIVKCDAPPRLPCASLLGTPVSWEFAAINTCNPGFIATWCEPESGSLFQPGLTPVTCYASNTLSGEVITCDFVVDIFVPLPRVRIGALGGLRIGWGERCDEFGLEWSPSLIPPAWSPVSSLPIGRWTDPTSGDTRNNARFPIPGPQGDPIAYFRLNNLPAVQKDFSAVPKGPFTNPAGIVAPMFLFGSLGGDQMNVGSLNNQNALAVDTKGLVANMPSNRVTWPNLFSGGPNLHSLVARVALSPNNLPQQFMNVEAIDSMGNSVGFLRYSNVQYGDLKFRSRGWPLDRIEFTMPNGGSGGVGRVDAIPGIPGPPSPSACTDFRSYPLGPVPNPWATANWVLTARDVNGVPYANGSIVDGPEGHGYNVKFSAEISFTNSTCCVATYVELAQNSGLVDLVAYDPAGTVLGTYRVTNAEANPVTVYFPPSSAPTCRIVITSPNDLTRILRICCVNSGL